MITIMLILLILFFTAKNIITLSAKSDEENFLAKGLNDWCIGLNIKQKVRIKNIKNK